MRVFTSFPIAGRVRGGMSINPNRLFVRNVRWQQLLSPTGKIALLAVWIPFGTVMVIWLSQNPYERWLSCVIAMTVVWWTLRFFLLKFFLRQDGIECDAPTETKKPVNPFHEGTKYHSQWEVSHPSKEQRFNSYGEPI